jgi:hypothetical protein
MHSAWEDLALGKDGEAVREVGHVVLSSLVDSFKGFVSLKNEMVKQYLERDSGVVPGNLVCCGVLINSVEDSG